MGQTVNLLVYTFGGSNPSSPTSESEMDSGLRVVLAFEDFFRFCARFPDSFEGGG